MGAGSSAPAESSDEDFYYDKVIATTTPKAETEPKVVKRAVQQTLEEFLASDDIVETPSNANNNHSMLVENTPKMSKSNEDTKKKGLFGFRKKEEDQLNEENKEVPKEDSSKTSKGFQLFKWRREEKKSKSKDEQIQDEIHDMEKTFESLGIASKSNGMTEGKTHRRNSNKRHSADDIQSLEPMRNRNIPRTRSHQLNPTNNVQHSSGSTRTFKYSWEEEQQKNPIKPDDWADFNLNAIDGFDIEKFRQLNTQESSQQHDFINALPHSIQNQETSSYSYDQRDKELLAAIEREYLAV